MTTPYISKTKHIITLTTLLIMLIGVFAIFAAAYYAVVESPSPGSFSNTFASGLTTLGISLIGFSVFSFALDTRNWRDYFSERIKEIVIDNNYLEMLDPETLKTLQVNALKAQFHNPRLDNEGGFLNYFHVNLHRYISEPYREDVSTEILMRESSAKPDCFEVVDKVVYVCRASSNRIQESVRWFPDKDEFDEVTKLVVSVQYPENHRERGKIVTIKDCKVSAEIVNGFSEPLEAYKEIDGLVVIIESEYTIKKGKFQYWQMANPTRNFDITVTYPPGSRIQFKTLVVEDVVSQITQQDGYLKFKYDSWLLPKSGIAWLITPTTCLKSSDCFSMPDAQPCGQPGPCA
jgi:hypothetical protein